jgi:Immunity protein 61
MRSYEPSPRLLNWAKRAGFEFRPPDGYPAAFYNTGWEDRYFVHSVDGPVAFKVTRAARSTAEDFLFDAYNSGAVDAYFWMLFGYSIRSSLRLPRLQNLTELGDVAEPYFISDSPGAQLLLTDGKNQPVMATSDDVSDIINLVRTSIALKSSAADIEHSFLAESGQPLFKLR